MVTFCLWLVTTLASLTFRSYELALRSDVQEKIRKYVMEVEFKFNGQINSEYANELPYTSVWSFKVFNIKKLTCYTFNM